MSNRSFLAFIAIAAAGCASADTQPQPKMISIAAPLTKDGKAAPAAPAWRSSVAAQSPATPAAPAAPAPNTFAAPSGAAAPAAAPRQAAAAPVALPTIPAGAKYSIFCESFNGPDRVQVATNLRDLLVKNSKLHDWYIIHQPTQSSLYHGYYSEFDPSAASDKAAKREAERAKRDLELVQSIPNPMSPDRKLFPRSLVLSLDSPDPDAPPEWNLSNAPGYWSVQIAAFTGADRKRQSVEAVREARAMTPPVPAFYYHGPRVSSVCIGSWDRTAVTVPEFMADPGNQKAGKGTSESQSLVFNLSGNELGEQVSQQRGPDGKPMKLLESTVEVNDPTLMKTLKDYPESVVDGYVVMLQAKDKKTGEPVKRPRPSMVVEIPRSEVAATGGIEAHATPDPDATLVDPSARSNQQLGSRLKGIGQ